MLISVCNVAANPRSSCLLLFQLDDQTGRWLDVGAGEPLVSSAGICADERYVYHVSIAQADFATLLTVFDRASLAPVHVHRLSEVRDAHSITRHRDELLVVSTGTDSVVAYQVSDGTLGPARLAWTPTDSGTDTHHLNSIVSTPNDVLCSGFGPQENGSWAMPKNGYVRSIINDTVVVGGLRQPHSLVMHAGRLYFCNSQEGTVNVPDGEIAYLGGYSRGLAFAPDGTILAGTSLSRKPSQPADERPVFHNPNGPGDIYGRCAVHLIPQDGGALAAASLQTFANEIYDLAFV